MANRAIEILLSLKDQFSGASARVVDSIKSIGSAHDQTAAKVESGSRRIEASSKGILSAFTAVKLGALAVVAGLGTLLSKVGDWTAAAAVQERAETKLAHTLTQLTGASQAQVQALKNQAAALQELTGYGDEAIISAQAMLGTFKLTAEEIGVLTPALLDMAEANRRAGDTSVDLEAIAGQLGKAYTDSAASLRRFNVTLSEAQEAQLNQATGMEKTRLLTEILKENFGGLAEAVGGDFDGAMRRAASASGDLDEALGALFTKNEAVRGLIQQITQDYQALTVAMSDPNGLFGQAVTGGAIAISIALTTIRNDFNLLQIGIQALHKGWLEFNADIADLASKASFGEVSERFAKSAANMRARSAELSKGIEEDFYDMLEASEAVHDVINNAAKAMESAGKSAGQMGAGLAAARGDIEKTQKAVEALGLDLHKIETGISTPFAKLIAAFDELASKAGTSSKIIAAGIDSMIEKASNLKEFQAIYDRLHAAYKEGQITIEEYNKAVAKLNESFKSNAEEMKKQAEIIKKVDEALKQAKTSWEAYSQIQPLWTAWQDGLISQEKYYEELSKILDRTKELHDAAQKAGSAGAKGFEDMASSAERAADAAEKVAEAVDKITDAELRRRNVSREEYEEGITSRTKGTPLPSGSGEAAARAAEVFGADAGQKFIEILTRLIEERGLRPGDTGADLIQVAWLELAKEIGDTFRNQFNPGIGTGAGGGGSTWTPPGGTWNGPAPAPATPGGGSSNVAPLAASAESLAKAASSLEQAVQRARPVEIKVYGETDPARLAEKIMPYIRRAEVRAL